MTVKHYAEYYYPGSLFEESERVFLNDGTEEEALLRAPKDAFAFSIVSVTEQTAILEDGVTFTHYTDVPVSSRIYIGGEVYTLEDIEREKPGSILLSNMRCNGYSHIVRTRCGNYQPFDPARNKVVKA